jgi:hypothetical protein
MLTDIESGNLPKNFVGIQIVMPEVYGINTNPTSTQQSLTPTLSQGEREQIDFS